MIVELTKTDKDTNKIIAIDSIVRFFIVVYLKIVKLIHLYILLASIGTVVLASPS